MMQLAWLQLQRDESRCLSNVFSLFPAMANHDLEWHSCFTKNFVMIHASVKNYKKRCERTNILQQCDLQADVLLF